MADTTRLYHMLETMLEQLKRGQTTQLETMHFRLEIKPTKKNIDILTKGMAVFVDGNITYNTVIVMMVAGGC